MKHLILTLNFICGLAFANSTGPFFLNGDGVKESYGRFETGYSEAKKSIYIKITNVNKDYFIYKNRNPENFELIKGYIDKHLDARTTNHTTYTSRLRIYIKLIYTKVGGAQGYNRIDAIQYTDNI